MPLNFLLMTCILTAASPIFFRFELSLHLVILIFVMAVLDTAGNYFYFKTFESTDATTAIPLLSLAPVFAFPATWLLIGQAESWGCALVACAITTLIISMSCIGNTFDKFRAKTLLPAISSSLLFGISTIPAKMILQSGDINVPTLYLLRAALIAAFAAIIFGRPQLSLKTNQIAMIVGRNLIVILQYLMLYCAFSVGSAPMSLAIASVSPVFVVLLSVLAGEPWSWPKLGTALLIVPLVGVLA
ncbi:hypothetical protein OCOJLMKI_4574 [Methylobacterium iners]|uniref:EamA domain-containing protein n=2 Tax=Methylobacterium iners TaxID=418707 RepID=A0ABQ4S408_9HYPH|nr:hypothetical protein OCOJLMKI_4574 [Methylobacterium iners]